MDSEKEAKQIVQILVDAGYIAYFAGGWVRDFAMGHSSSDIDIATNAHPEEVLKLFPRSLKVGIAFGVVVVLRNGEQFEVASFREDLNYVHGRKPEKVVFSTAEEDAKRRDFTINGMFYDPLEGVIHDFVGGMKDIKRGVVQTIGDPFERFYEDRLRMIRAVRFSARFGFAIDVATEEAIRKNAPTLFPAVAWERVHQEFEKMARYPRFDWALSYMHRLELLQVIFPELEDVPLHTIKERVADFDAYPQECPWALFLPALFPDASLDQLIELCERLRMGKKEQHKLRFYVEHLPYLRNEKEGDRHLWVKFYAHPFSQLALEVEADSTHHRARQEALKSHIERLIERKPLVTSEHLRKRGIEPGKEMGQLLAQAEKITILEDLHDPEKVLERLL